MYVKRNEEEILEKAFNSNKLELVMVYGRRRVGKTTMLANFIKDKKSVFHVTTSTKSTQILEDLALDFSYSLKGVKPNFTQF